ncbi:hypothetical protein AKO1_005783 [Acrasis kona]|uniref:Carbohydrate kinase PfkB domain-containing protein n=1 Tax=Acrasis kona TaxID=1008807 RepID=A0AAW2YK05_9EUKA
MDFDISVAFVGNFVQDTIKTFHNPNDVSNLGGSVAFGSKAARAYAFENKTFIYIISKLGRGDHTFMDPYLEDMRKTGIDVDHALSYEEVGNMTCYKLTYTNPETNSRDMILQRRGFSLNDKDFVINALRKASCLPDLIFFVPVAAEFDAQLVKNVVTELVKDYKSVPNKPFPFIITDIQGYVRAFDPESGAVSILSSKELIKTLNRLGKYVFFLKCDYDEAKSALSDLVQDQSAPTPTQCAEMLHRIFGFKCVAVTMGPGGCVVSAAVNKGTRNIDILPSKSIEDNFDIITKYISAFTPKRVVDETGSGDTFLSTTFTELLLLLKEGGAERVDQINCDVLFEAVELASAATSHLVERNHDQIFSTRQNARIIRNNNKRNKPFE